MFMLLEPLHISSNIDKRLTPVSISTASGGICEKINKSIMFDLVIVS